MRMLWADDPTNFLERTAKIQWGMMLCVYSISHAPALIKLAPEQSPYEGFRLLLFLTCIVQVHDLIQDVMKVNFQGRKIFVNLVTGESVESFVLSVLAASLTGILLSPVVPFDHLQAAVMGMAIAITAFFGRLCWVAIQQDRGRKGVVVARAKPPMTERLISLCFAAPLFFHLTRFFFYGGNLAQF
jgi:phosphatidate cytidylyltransferase